MSKAKLLTYTGTEYTVTWDRSICTHSEECIRTDSKLFEKGRSPWGQPDLVEFDELERVIKRCPSGALQYRATASEAETLLEAPEPVNTAIAMPNGPLYVRGNLSIVGSDPENPTPARRVALCRCGHSKNKPYCDNSHVAAGFKDSGAVGREGPGLEEKGGELQIIPNKNASVRLVGNVTILAASGCSRWNGPKVSICRCGLSKQKPFCDSSHREGNFETE
ncbi:MAG: CDGSH iron-sulfur domain-containing protein [Bacteroidetes bacterium]|nr:CDGSH iron-sulfur domain-containing protein [Bacteroidota bacterium]